MKGMGTGREIAAKISPTQDLLKSVGSRNFGTILCDPPWQFQNRTGKVAPEHKRLSRYGTLKLEDIIHLRVSSIAAPTCRK